MENRLFYLQLGNQVGNANTLCFVDLQLVDAKPQVGLYLWKEIHSSGPAEFKSGLFKGHLLIA